MFKAITTFLAPGPGQIFYSASRREGRSTREDDQLRHLGSQALHLLIEDLAGRCDLLLTSVEKVSEQLIQVKQSLKLIV